MFQNLKSLLGNLIYHCLKNTLCTSDQIDIRMGSTSVQSKEPYSWICSYGVALVKNTICGDTLQVYEKLLVEASRSLLKRDLRQSLFTLFTNWAGKYGLPSVKTLTMDGDLSNKKHIELQYAALQAMSSLLCCGPCFDALTEESPYYLWLDGLLNSTEEKVSPYKAMRKRFLHDKSITWILMVPPHIIK